MTEKNAIVTGASSGIGRAIAIELAKNNVYVILVARRKDRLISIKDEIERCGGHADYIVADLMKENTVVNVLEQAKKFTDQIDIIVNAAGRSGMTPLDQLEPRTWYSTMQLNVNVPYEFSRYLLPDMKKRNRGWIINISSEVGCSTVEKTGAYGVSKCALNRLTELIDKECRDYNIHAYAICPGWVQTDMTGNPEFYGVKKEEVLQPEDIATYVAYICSRRSVVRINPIIEITPMKSKTAASESTKLFFNRRCE